MHRPATSTTRGDPCSRCGGAHLDGAPCSSPLPTLAFAGASGPAAPAAQAPAVDPLLGAQVGSFRILKLLGRGGMGTVYLAEHPVIGSRVAVKFLHEAMASDAQVVSRFYDEARAVNLIGHENIVGIYDLSVLPPGRFYFVMEYLDGETLAERARAGPLDPAIALDVLLQLCDALQCAHERGVVHRDLKPENVFLVQRRGRRDFVKLVDFGIAKLRDDARAAGRTESGVIVGTPEYMAPEQCEDGAIDARTDVYALGVIAFELATGRLPFTGRGVAQLLLAHLRASPPRPSQLAPVIPAFERAILRALEKDSSARFPDMAAFARALREAQAELPARTPPPARPQVNAGARGHEAVPRQEELAAEVNAGAGSLRLAVRELTRNGAFLRADAGLPPLLSRIRLTLAHSALRAPLALTAEVVRHVSPAEAGAWRMDPGFAVQFLELTPADRAALATLADEQRRETPAPAAVAGGEPLLRALEARAGASHYAFLALPLDAEFADVRRAARGLREALEALRLRPLAADHPARATTLLVRLDAAQAALATPASRLAHDAERGNALGVSRCLATGLSRALVDARRAELLRAAPARAAEAGRQRARAEVARKLGNAAAALTAYEAALAADPLDVATLDAYLALRRGPRPSPR